MKTHQQELLSIARQFDLEIPPLQGQLACAFVGEWSHGKSALINSLVGLPLLPSQPTPTNKTVVRLSRSKDMAPAACVHDNNGEILRYTGQDAIDALQNATKNIPGIEYQASNLDIPDHTLFIDTPGINDTDQTASTRAESVSADIVVFVVSADASAINQTQINFIQQVILGKADLNDIFFVLTHSDLVKDVQERASLMQRVGSHIGSNRVFFLSNKDQDGVQAFRQAFYAYITERQVSLLEYRRNRHFRQISDELEKKVKIERMALTQYKTQTADQREQLLVQIRESRGKETAKKSELRARSRQRLSEALQEVRDLMKQSIDNVEDFIESSQTSQLQQRGYIQQKIQSIMEQQIQPAVQTKLENLLRTIQGEVQEGQRYSSDLLVDLIHLPEYTSPLARITAEQIMPIAVLGSIVMFGWLSIPTFLLGYLTLKAREFGLTRYGDKTGILDTAIDKLKDMAAKSYKQALKMTVAQTLNNYLNQITDYFRAELEKVTEQALKQVNYVESLENTLQRLRGEGGKEIIEREIRLDKTESLLNADSAERIHEN
jgi:GTPase Era involved in 16S rRNA processing